MKLLKNYHDNVSKLRESGEITKAWFTTFNINLDFFERYLLAPLVGMDLPRNQLDFELLQQALLNINIHCFCDQQVFDLSQAKRTSIPVHLVRTSLLNMTSGIFHPKIIYLENSRGDAILGAGSSNLSIAGWAQNHEVFSFEIVQTELQKQSISKFFQGLGDACQIDPSIDMHSTAKLTSANTNQGNLPKKWEFFHNVNLNGESFLENLLKGTEETSDTELWVMSPYFSTDLGQLIQKILDKGISRIRVIPDLDNEQIRTTYSEALKKALTQKQLFFHELPAKLTRKNANSQTNVMRHAKLWLTKKKLAIGSWNMTRPATGNADEGENNIEAGLIYSLQEEINPFPTSHSITVTSGHFMEKNVLDSTAPILDTPASPLNVQVLFNWDTSTYAIRIKHLDPTKQTNLDTYLIHLPDIGSHTLSEVPPTIKVSNPSQLLRERFFTITDQSTQNCYSGIILETELEHRRGMGYANIHDLIAAVLSKDLINNTGGRTIVRQIGINDDYAEWDETGINIQTHTQLDYYTLFKLFKGYLDLFENADKEPSEPKKQKNLKKMIATQPGSLVELAEKLQSIMNQPEYSNVFKWFTAQEMNHLVKKISAQHYMLDEEIKKQLQLDPPDLIDSDQERAAYIKHILDGYYA
jgi:hypothetical protein